MKKVILFSIMSIFFNQAAMAYTSGITCKAELLHLLNGINQKFNLDLNESQIRSFKMPGRDPNAMYYGIDYRTSPDYFFRASIVGVEYKSLGLFQRCQVYLYMILQMDNRGNVLKKMVNGIEE